MDNTQLKKIFPFLEWLPKANKTSLKADFIAGLTGAVMVLPQGVAFAMVAGLPPIFGLYSAMIMPVIAALFGSSRHMVTGPAMAISIVVFSAVSQFAPEGSPDFIRLALSLTLLTGIFQLGLGLARMGAFVNFVSHVVIVGFTAGAAILIMVGQLKQIFEMPVPSGSTIVETFIYIFKNTHQINWIAVLVAVVTAGLAFGLKKISSKIPHLLIALIAGSFLGYLLGGGSVLRLVGELPTQLPPFSMPDISFKTLQKLGPNAFALALLGLIEAAAIAKSIATKSGQQINSNQEFIGQGLANTIGAFFSSYAGSGSFSRSGINVTAGARTPLSAIFSALLLILLLFFVGPLTAHLPMAAMGGIIFLVGYNLIDVPGIRTIIKASKRQSVVLAITFLSTMLLNLEFAIYIGMLFSLFFYLRRTSKPRLKVLAPDPSDVLRKFINLQRKDLQQCPQLKILRLDGSLFFGAVDHVAAQVLDHLDGTQRNILLVASGVNFIDVAGSEWLVQLSKRVALNGGKLYIAGLKLDAQETLIKGGYKADIGDDRFFPSKREAIESIFAQLDPDICKKCTARIFLECDQVEPIKEQIRLSDIKPE
ncbi:MAG: SulP family inorganic anion transporter [Saprospiraceae bacterium]